MHLLEEDGGLRDAGLVVAARQQVDPVLARLIAQPFDADLIAELTRWLTDVYPRAASAFDRMQDGERGGRFCPQLSGAGGDEPVAGDSFPSRALTVVEGTS